LSTTSNGILLSSIINKWECFWVLWKFGTLVLFYKALALLSTLFSFLKPWLTNSIGWPPTFTYHGEVPLKKNIRLQWSDQLSCKINDEQMKLPPSVHLWDDVKITNLRCLIDLFSCSSMRYCVHVTPSVPWWTLVITRCDDLQVYAYPLPSLFSNTGRPIRHFIICCFS
jgi:hypothetical protein